MCKSCYIADYNRRNPDGPSATWIARHPEEMKRHARKRVLKGHGLTIEQYETMWRGQGGKCANPGCADAFPLEMPNYRLGLQVDHCHATGRVRGLLCGPCNTALGYTRDDPERLKGLIVYLARSVN